MEYDEFEQLRHFSEYNNQKHFSIFIQEKQLLHSVIHSQSIQFSLSTHSRTNKQLLSHTESKLIYEFFESTV